MTLLIMTYLYKIKSPVIPMASGVRGLSHMAGSPHPPMGTGFLRECEVAFLSGTDLGLQLVHLDGLPSNVDA